ncbi:MAG: hypothetical protein ACI3ZZ_02515 [Candidatus Aphodosoma sp.]
MINVLNGKLMYLKMVKGDDDSVFLRLSNKFNQLAMKYLNEQNTDGFYEEQHTDTSVYSDTETVDIDQLNLDLDLLLSI